MGNNHRDDVAVFRFEVFDHHIEVHDIRVEVAVRVLAGRFVATAEVPSSFQMSVDSERVVREETTHRKSKRKESMVSCCPNFFW